MVAVVGGVEAPASDRGYVDVRELEAVVVATHVAAIISDNRDGKEVDELEASSRQGLKQLRLIVALRGKEVTDNRLVAKVGKTAQFYCIAPDAGLLQKSEQPGVGVVNQTDLGSLLIVCHRVNQRRTDRLVN